MKLRILICSAMLLATSSMLAQKKDATSVKTSPRIDVRSNSIQADLTKEVDAKKEQEQQQKLAKNKAKSEAARAKRDQISEAVQKRLNKQNSKSRKQ